MGLVYNTYLNSDKIFGCKSCKTHLASHDSIISRVRRFFLNNMYSLTLRLRYDKYPVHFHTLCRTCYTTNIESPVLHAILARARR